MAGFEPALSGTPSRRIARLSHILSVAPVRVAEALVQRRESNPFLHLERVMSLPVDDGAMTQVGGEGVEPRAFRLTTMMAAALQAAVRNTTRRVAQAGVEPAVAKV